MGCMVTAIFRIILPEEKCEIDDFGKTFVFCTLISGYNHLFPSKVYRFRNISAHN